MAAIVDCCRWIPTAGGTTDWTYLAIVVGFQSPTAAGMTNGVKYKYRAESADLSQWEIGEGAWNNTTGVLPRTTVLFNSLGTTAKINFSAAPQVAIVLLNEDHISIEVSQSFSTAQQLQALTNISGVSYGTTQTLTGSQQLQALVNITGVSYTSQTLSAPQQLQVLTNVSGVSYAAQTLTGVQQTQALANIAGAPLASPTLTGTPTAPTAAAYTNNTQLATTAYVDAKEGSGVPLVDGTAAAGASHLFSKQDHVHPTDTSRQAALGFTPVQQGTGVGQQSNTIKIGYSGSNPKITVDATDFGNIWTSANLVNVSQLVNNSGYITGITKSMIETAMYDGVLDHFSNSIGTDGSVSIINTGPVLSYMSGTTLNWRVYGGGVAGGDGGYYILYQGSSGVKITPGATSWSAYSDRRIKPDFEGMDVLSNLESFRAGRFTNKISGRREIGIIAQEQIDAWPELIQRGKDDEDVDIVDPMDHRLWSAQYERFGIIALQGVKDLLDRVKQLETEVKELKRLARRSFFGVR